MKKYGLPVLFAAFLIILAIWSQIPESSSSPYTITEPFVFPEVTDKIPHYKQVALCTIPDEIIAQMSTEALLETYLASPMALIPPLDDLRYRDRFEYIKTEYHFGFTELLMRPDLPDCLVEIYRNTKPYYNPFYKFFSAEKQEKISNAVYENDILRIMRLEIFATQIDFTGREEALREFEREIETRILKQQKCPEIYGENPIPSKFHWFLHLDEVREEIHDK